MMAGVFFKIPQKNKEEGLDKAYVTVLIII